MPCLLHATTLLPHHTRSPLTNPAPFSPRRLQEIKAGDEDRTRALFERSTSLPLPPRKMKFLFKRWLEWEKDVSGGEGEHVDAVKRKAMAFVESSLKA